MFRKHLPLFALMVFALSAAVGCAPLPTGPALLEATAAPVTTATSTVAVTAPTTQPPALEATVEVPATPAPAATESTSAATAIAATATAAPATATAATAAPATATAATPTGPARYQGPNPYRATPEFEVVYDPAMWEYVEDDGSGRQSQLKHTAMPGCAVWLRAGPVGATPVATVWRAERAWTIAQVQADIILYSAPQDDITWIFGVLLPEAYSGRGNSSCQDAAEQVIDTFKVLE